MKHVKLFEQFIDDLTESKLNENTKYQVNSQDDNRKEFKKFKDKNKAIAYAENEIKNNKGLKFIAVYNPEALFASQYEEIIAWWGDGSTRLDDAAKKDSVLASKKIEG